MRGLGLQGVVRGRRFRTTVSDDTADRPSGLVNRHFTATCPNQLNRPGFSGVRLCESSRHGHSSNWR